ncbi:MAG TPA: nicotinate-nucleotide adenylyltransferase [Vicinamibacterales bacterium]|nr:nicotinate-nucleotide adenylyltransferase [Vicinamibacterales bacterium]
MRRGVLGGTFDPIHVGHLDVARAAASALGLDRVELMPANLPPHRTTPHASARDRLAMVELAVEVDPQLVASDLELHTDGPSYTNTTLDRLAAAGVDLRTVFFITGADAFRDLPSWRNYPAILDRCHFVAVSRPGCAAGTLRQLLPAIASRMIDGRDAVPSHPSVILVDAPTAPVSSTDIRQRLASGRSIDGLVPPAVASYIERHGLYRTPHSKEPNGQS